MQVQNGFDVLFFKAFVDVKLFDKALARSLHSEDVVCDPIAMKSFDSIRLYFVGEVIFLRAFLSSAKLAQEYGFLVKLFTLELCYLGFFISVWLFGDHF